MVLQKRYQNYERAKQNGLVVFNSLDFDFNIWHWVGLGKLLRLSRKELLIMAWPFAN